MALTGIVFSLTFLMVQFSATAYSPRLVMWIARDPVLSHALGVFSATFLYAIAALSWLDRGNSRKVLFISAWAVIALLLASVGMFIALIQRVGLLQINRMLLFIANQGREVIEKLYGAARSALQQATDPIQQHQSNAPPNPASPWPASVIARDQHRKARTPCAST